MGAKEIVRQMTLQEKVNLLCGNGPFTVSGAERFGVPPLKMSDGPSGVKEWGQPNICFPSASVLACSFDEELAEDVGKAIGTEAAKYAVDVLLGPGLNLKRSPLCGRNFEYFSEDPVLSGMMAAAYVRGVQACGVAACLKHFAVNNQEKKRMKISAQVDEQTLRETYLKGFEIAVRYGKPKAVMSAYNKINGIYCSQNRKLLTQILRKEWKFKGAVISDWCAVEDIVEALKAGLDIDMPGNDGISARRIETAIREGKLSKKVVDRAAERVVRLAMRDKRNRVRPNVNAEEICLRAAAESMVLLKNEGVLPLSAPQKVLAVGKLARFPRYQGGGSANVGSAEVKITPLRALGELFETEYIESYSDRSLQARGLIENADVAVLYAGPTGTSESEGYDRRDIFLPQEQRDCIRFLAENGKRPIVVLQCGSAVETESWKEYSSAILLCGYAGQRCGEAVARILSGQQNPCGKLVETYPNRLQDTPAYLSFAGEEDKVYYGERMFVGYKYYAARDIRVSYPFGFGLSYTKFRYSDLRIRQKGKEVLVCFTVQNEGLYTGKEIVQVYVGETQALPHRPKAELKAFRKILLNAGESTCVEILLKESAFEQFDEKAGRFLCRTGHYWIEVGASSEDIRLRSMVFMDGDKRPKVPADANTLVGEICERKEVRDMVMGFLLPYIKIWFTGTEEGTLSADDPFVKNMVENMPLRAFSYFSKGKLDDDKIRELLNKINDTGESGEEL